MTKCEHKKFSLEVVIDRTITISGPMGLVLDGRDKKAVEGWAKHEGFKTTKRCDDCGEQL